jgi:plasmid replication initiation protein|tara:strand:- start:926 stop:1618 length:693 start_codon:yes stop_codon:yes gene_type:complete
MSLVKVTKANYLVEASYSLTLQEQRLILACLSKIDSRAEPAKEITLLASEYSELMNVDIKNAHRELQKASQKLYERSIVVKDPEKIEEFRWIQKKIHYQKGEGRIKLFWSDDVLTYIGQLKRRFTTYRLADVASLNTSYSIRLYELLMQFNSTKQRSISVDDFRSLFQLNDKYPLFRDLNKRVIKPAVKEINSSSNLEVFYSTTKKGKNIVELHFDFQEKKQIQIEFMCS